MKKSIFAVLALGLCLTTATALFACGGNNSSSTSSSSSSGSSESAALTKADYSEAFTAVQTALESETSSATPTAFFTAQQQVELVGYYDLGITQDHLVENSDSSGLINAKVFTYLFVQTLNNEDFTLTDEAFACALETAGTCTGSLQFTYENGILHGSMYFTPNGSPSAGLFTIAVNYDFENSQINDFEWLLKMTGAPLAGGCRYYYYDGAQGYTVNSDQILTVEDYLGEKLDAYTTPTETPFDLVDEWTATNNYANSGR